MEKTQLIKKIKFLKIWLFSSNLVLVFLVYESFSNKVSIDELTAKRINIIGENNSLRMVISNEQRQHSGRIAGKDLDKRNRPAGILFFNNEGNESGGIISHVYSNDGRKNSGMSFTMDRYNNDQVIQILNNEVFEGGDEKIQRGLLISEFPKGAKFFNLQNEYTEIRKIKNDNIRSEKIKDLIRREGAKKRVYLGKSTNDEAGLQLYDQNGVPRLKVFIDEKGQPKIQYTGKSGKMKDLINAEK